MSTTASEIKMLSQWRTDQLRQWSTALLEPIIINRIKNMPLFEDKLTLVRTGKKKFIVKRQWGAALMTYKCGYPEAQRRFALLVITRRLTA